MVDDSNLITLTFPVAINRQFQGKVTPGGRRFWRFNMTFENEQLTLDGLIATITAGHAWTAPHRHVRHRRPTRHRPDYTTTYRVKANVIESQLLALDSDTGDERSDFSQLLADPFIRRHAALIHSTASSTLAAPRSRVIFLLDEPLSPDEYELALRALLERYPFCDQSVKHAAVVFFGAEDCAYCRLNRLLPVAVLRERLLAPFQARRQAERRRREAERQARVAERGPVSTPSAEAVGRYVAGAMAGIADELATLPAGQGLRHEGLFTAAVRVGRLQAAGWLSHEARRTLAAATDELVDAAEDNGYIDDYGVEDALRTIDNGLAIGRQEPAEEPLWQEERAYFEIGERVVARAGERHLAEGRVAQVRYLEEEGRWEFALEERAGVWFARELLESVQGSP